MQWLGKNNQRGQVIVSLSEQEHNLLVWCAREFQKKYDSNYCMDMEIVLDSILRMVRKQQPVRQIHVEWFDTGLLIGVSDMFNHGCDNCHDEGTMHQLIHNPSTLYLCENCFKALYGKEEPNGD